MRRFFALCAAVVTSMLMVLAIPVLTAGPAGAAQSPVGVVPGTWHRVATPIGSINTEDRYTSISCVGPNFCMTVGDAFNGITEDEVPIGATWNGSSWTAISNFAPASGAKSGFSGVSCLSPAWCFAVGWQQSSSDFEPLAEMWNGTSWSIVPSPNPFLNGSEFNGVSCTSTTFCEAVGYWDNSSDQDRPLLQVWNGATLTEQEPPVSGILTYTNVEAVSCVGKWCTAVGSTTSSFLDVGSLIMALNNGTWTVSTTPAVTAVFFDGVSCPSTTFCVAVGAQNAGFLSTPHNLIEQWNGKTNTWTVDPTSSATDGDDFSGVSCLGPASCVAVGLVYTDPGQNDWSDLIYAWNGSTWAIQNPPLAGIARPHIVDVDVQVNAVDCINNDICMGVGAANGSVQALSATVYRPGYTEVAADGGLFNFGGAPFYGSIGGHSLNAPVVGMAMTPDGGGYWEVATDGGIFAYGDAGYFGSMGGKPLNAPIVGMVPTLDGRGYWLVASDGGLFAFGDAAFYGSMGGKPLNKPIVGMAIAPSGCGYYEVASDGGLFAFGLPGQAPFLGSTGSITINSPIVGMAVTPKGGYYEVAKDGGLFAFGGIDKAPFSGSMGGKPLAAPIVGMAIAPAGGYYEVASDGGLFNFGGAPYHGSMGGKPLVEPIVGIAT